jgi:glutamate dehydrogenase/leucine dehydrogenase
VINAAGVIHAENEIRELDNVITDDTFRHVALNLMRIFAKARDENRSPYRIAMEAAHARIEKITSVSRILTI